MDFLNKEQEVNIPVGGTFNPNGIVSLWQAAMLYMFSTQSPLDESVSGKPGVFSTQRGAYYWHYFIDPEQAETVRTEMGVEYPPSLTWHFETKRDDVLNFSPEATEKFGEYISYDVKVRSLMSNKYRHEYHLIALPAAVNAMAIQLGYETSGFDLNELVDQNTLYNQDFEFSMIGSADAKDGEENHFTNSELWQRRVALWQSLGEDDPRAVRLINSDAKFATTSEKLSNALGIANYTWTKPIYAKVVTVNDPREEGVTSEGKRLSIPAIYELFENKEAAMASVAQAETATSAPVASTVTASTPPIPAGWVSNAGDWPQYLRDFKAENPSLLPPPVGKQVVALAESTLGVTEAELRAWWDQV